MKLHFSRKISFNDSITDGENSPTKLFNSSDSGLTPLILQKYSNYQFQYLNLAQILSKLRSQRTHTENRFITQFARKNTALKQLADIVGPDFDRGILRDAKLEHFQAQQIIEFKNTPINRIYIILEGKLATIKNGDDSDMLSQWTKKNIYEELTKMARKDQKKITKLMRKESSFENDCERIRQNYVGQTGPQLLEIYEKNNTFGDKQRCQGPQHKHTVIALEPSLVAMIDIRNFMHWLNYCFQRRVQTSFSLLRKHSCFSHISNQIIEEIIEFLSVINLRKGDLVYQQGSQSTHIHFLQEGQLKIQKQSHLFVDNPNELYVDRRTLMSERQIKNKEYLQYANLQRLYNYRPTSKTIDLGIITPICLFGEQQLLENRPRDTSIRCSSLRATCLAIQLKKLFQLLGEGSKTFLKAVKQSMKEKVRYRQAAFAVAISLQNRSKLNYFYEGDSPSHKRSMITKINSKISNSSTIVESDDTNVQKSTLTDRKNRSTFLENRSNAQDVVPPSYNSFNFHRMLKTKLKKHSKVGDSSSDDEHSITNQKVKQENQRQLKLVNDSHTWRGIKAKVSQQFKLGKKMGTLRHKVNFGSPLIDEKYFRQIEYELKRLDRQKKQGKTDFKIRCKSFSSSRQTKR